MSYTEPFPESERIVNPAQRTVYPVASFCPVNTYNRVCSFTQKSKIPAAECDACPSGWHTSGATGAWFCLPPAGLVFSERTRIALHDGASAPWVNGTQWRRRDLWRYEVCPKVCYG